MSSLFRVEALAQYGNRLHGEVVLSQPLSTKLFAVALFGIVGIAAVWVMGWTPPDGIDVP